MFRGQDSVPVKTVLEILEKSGISLNRSTLFLKAKKYEMYKDSRASIRSGLDPKKAEAFIKAATSPLRIINICQTYGVKYQNLNYILYTLGIVCWKPYGYKAIKDKKDLERVKNYIEKRNLSQGNV